MFIGLLTLPNQLNPPLCRKKHNFNLVRAWPTIIWLATEDGLTSCLQKSALPITHSEKKKYWVGNTRDFLSGRASIGAGIKIDKSGINKTRDSRRRIDWCWLARAIGCGILARYTKPPGPVGF